MTAVNNQSLSAGAPDPLVRTFHLGCALGVCESAIQIMIRKGRLPRPDAGGSSRATYWRLSTLRACNPALADSVEILLKLPRIAAV